MNALPVARLLLLLLPVACVSLFGRVYYTPDEPREASLIASMSAQPLSALPQLAGETFAEKPPLLYWLGAVATDALGATPAASRVPNLLYLLTAVFALAWLATRAAGAGAGFATGIVTGTALQLYVVESWLATDAPLLAGVALALAGSYAALTADTRRARLGAYLVFHLGLLLAFFAKGPAGWLVPVAAYLTVVGAERRWRELVSVELWAGVPLVLGVIAAWVYAVAAAPGGHEALRILFWYNLIGRVVPLAAPTGLAYAGGHQNSPAKYLLELPLYLLPWTPLAFAAARRVVRGWRERGLPGTATRLAVGAIVPATLLLSLAATARGVYYGPPLLGFALLIGLYAGSAGAALDRTDRACWRLCGWLIAALALVLASAALLAGLAPGSADTLGIALAIIAAGAGLSAAWLALRLPVAAAGAMPRLALALALSLTIAVGPLYRELNHWQSLETVAARVRAAAAGAPLLLVGADETTLALASLYLPEVTRTALRAATAPDAVARANAALAASDGAARVLWLVPDPRRWTFAAWRAFLGYGDARPPAPPALDLPAGLGALRLECLIERPGGRSYALLAAVSAPFQAAATCR